MGKLSVDLRMISKGMGIRIWYGYGTVRAVGLRASEDRRCRDPEQVQSVRRYVQWRSVLDAKADSFHLVGLQYGYSTMIPPRMSVSETELLLDLFYCRLE